MPHVSQRVSLRLASAALAAVAVAGCDDARVADRRVHQTIQESRMARLQEGGLEESRKLLDKAATETEAGAATKAHVKSLLGHAQMDAANERINDPEEGVNHGHQEIARLLWEIGQLAQQIEMSNTLATSYAAYEPAEAKQAAATHASAVTGGAQQEVWVGEDATAIPTIAAAQQKIAQLQDEISRQQQAIEKLQQQRAQAAAQAQQLQSQSETQEGRQALDTFRSAAAARKQAADTQNQIDVEQSKLARLQQDAALAQAQLQAVSAARQQFESLAQNLDAGWKEVQVQVQRQKQLAAEILNGNRPSSIAAKAAKLAEQDATTRETYQQAEQNLTEAIQSFQAAGSDAGRLTTELRQAGSTLASDNQLKRAMDQLIEVYNPNVFKLAQANATLALAQLQASRAQVLAERAALVARLGPVLQQAGLALPKVLDEPRLGEELKAVTASADEQFVAAQQLYEDVSQGGGGSESDRNAGRAGQIYALYGRALLARATGNEQAAKDHLAQAKQQRDVVLQESRSALAALPAELFVAAAAAPPAPATDGAAPAPAPTPDGEAAPTPEGGEPAPAPEGGESAPAEPAPAEPAPQ